MFVANINVKLKPANLKKPVVCGKIRDWRKNAKKIQHYSKYNILDAHNFNSFSSYTGINNPKIKLVFLPKW